MNMWMEWVTIVVGLVVIVGCLFSIRGLNAEIRERKKLLERLRKMGEEL